MRAIHHVRSTRAHEACSNGCFIFYQCCKMILNAAGGGGGGGGSEVKGMPEFL